MNHSIEELKPLLSTLQELSCWPGDAYVIAAEPLSDRLSGQP